MKVGIGWFVRNGFLPEREIMTGVGTVPVKQPRVRDKRSLEQREFFTTAVLPKYLRKTKSMKELIRWLYLKGISTKDFPEAQQALLGTDAKGLSASTITRLKSVREDEYAEWSKRSLVGKAVRLFGIRPAKCMLAWVVSFGFSGRSIMGWAKYSSEQWSAWIDQQLASGQTIVAFSGSIGVTENSFYVWRRKRRSDRAVASRPGKLSESFAPLSIVETNGVDDRLDVELPCGAVVRVPGNKQLIRQTLEVLLEFGQTTTGQATSAVSAAASSDGSSC